MSSPTINFPQVNACLFNLIIYSDKEQTSHAMRAYVDQLAKKFPCRLILIELNTDPNLHGFDVKVVSEGYDQLIIQTPRERLQCVSFLILPYIVPDLPIYLMWGQDPTTETQVLPYLMKYGTRLIFDSTNPENLQKFSSDLVRDFEESKISLVDLNWARLTGWRTVLAQTFDGPERLNHIKNSEIIQIAYVDDRAELNPHPARQALFLQAWLATQLKWKFLKMDTEGKTLRIYYNRGKNEEVKIELNAVDNDVIAPGEIVEIEIATKTQQFFAMKRKAGSPQIVVHVSNPETCELPFAITIPSWQKGQLIVKEIFYQEPSAHYINTLQTISRTDWSIR